MSLLAATCAALMHASSPSCGLLVEPSVFTAQAVADADLADVRGLGLPMVGLDEAQPAADAEAVQIASLGPRVSDTTREIIDNWNVDVGVPLIAAATAAASH